MNVETGVMNLRWVRLLEMCSVNDVDSVLARSRDSIDTETRGMPHNRTVRSKANKTDASPIERVY